MHNDSKSNPADEASPGITENTFIRKGLWVEGPDFLSSLEPQWEDGVQEYAIHRNVSTPRRIWVIGRITDFFSERNGFVRHVKVKIKTSTLRREPSWNLT